MAGLQKGIHGNPWLNKRYNFQKQTPDKLKKGEVGEYKDFKAGKPNSAEEEDNFAYLKNGRKKKQATVLGGGGEREVGL